MFYGFVCIAYVNICQQDMASSIFSSSFIGGSNEYVNKTFLLSPNSWSKPYTNQTN